MIFLTTFLEIYTWGHTQINVNLHIPGFRAGVSPKFVNELGSDKHHEGHVNKGIKVDYEVPEHIKKLYFRKADTSTLQKQKQILTLFYRPNQQPELNEHVDLANSFSPFDAQNTTLYLDEGAVQLFYEYWQYGPLAKGAAFSIFDVKHLEQAIALSKLLFFAKDYDVFYKTASWARLNVNEGLFVYSLYIAVIHRADTKEVMLPPLYEISPYLFFSADVINQAQYYKQIHNAKQNDQDKGNNVYTIYSNSSYNNMNVDYEQSSLAYYLEDIGVNSFFGDIHNNFPFWMKGSEFGWSKNLQRGILFYSFYQNTWARYQLERIPFGLDNIEYLNWDLPVKTPYYSNLAYPNGVHFPNRPKFAKLHEYFYNYGQSRWAQSINDYSYTLVNDFERRIVDVIESGAIWSEAEGKLVKLESDEFLNVLGNLIETNADSPNTRYYGPIWFFARHLLGYSTQSSDQNKLVPSALEHYETSLRDPVFYQLIRKLVILPYQRYLARIPPYTKNELKFPGVEITEVRVDPLITYNEPFYSDLINSVFYKPNEPYGDFLIRVRQNRLNHAPFEFKLNVKSDRPVKASVKVFLGPKYDREGRPIEICQNRLNFVPLDHFVADLQVGDNLITRKSSDNQFYAPDKVSFAGLYQNVEAALKGERDFIVDLRQNLYGFPQRFMLPKGSVGGTPYQLFFAVYPYAEQQIQQTNNVNVNTVDNYSVGYPLDRFVKFQRLWEQIPNFRSEEVKIYFKE